MTKNILLGPSLVMAPNPLTNSCCFFIMSSSAVVVAPSKHKSKNLLLLMAHPMSWKSALFMTQRAQNKRADSSGAGLPKWGTRLLIAVISLTYSVKCTSVLFVCSCKPHRAETEHIILTELCCKEQKQPKEDCELS